jgi:hypothetical protein
MSDPQADKMGVEVGIVLQRLIPPANHQANARSSRQDGGILLRVSARAKRSEALLIATIDRPQHLLGRTATCTWRPIKRFL